MCPCSAPHSPECQQPANCRCCLPTLPCASACSRIFSFGRKQLLAEGGADVLLLHGPGRPCSGHHEPGEIASPSGRARACVLVWAPTYPPSVQTCSQHPGTGCQRLEAPSSSNVEQLRGRSCRSPPIPQTAAAAHLVQIMSRGLLKAGTVQTPPQLSKSVQAVQAAMQLQPSNSELDRE